MRKAFCLIVLLCLITFCLSAAEPATPTAPPATSEPKPAPVPAPDNGNAPINPVADPNIGVTVTAPAGALVTPSELNSTPSAPGSAASKSGVSITNIDRKDYEASQDTTTAETLRNVPGVTIGQTGRKGSITNLFIRGGNNNQTEVMEDGFRVNRQGQGFDFDAQDPTGLQRIEVSRGMGSALYGTEALTGTVNIITQKGFGDPELTTSVAAGTNHTDRETIQLVGACDKFAYNISSAHLLREDAAEPNSRLEAYNYAVRLDYDIDKNNSLKLIVRGKDMDRGFYESVSLATQVGTSVVPADTNDTLKSKDILVGLEYSGKICPIWDTNLRVGYYRSEHDFNLPQPAPPQNFLLNSPMFGGPRSAASSADETRPSIEWRNTVTTFDSDCLRNFVTAGFYAESELFDQQDTVLFASVNRHHYNISGYVQDRIELFDRVNLEAGFRHEANGEFGGLNTGRGNASIDLHEIYSRAFGSVGNGYRPPSFFELFAPAIGNPSLQVERNFAYDAGLEHTFWCDRVTLRETYFHNHFDDFISLSSAAPFMSTQQPTAETDGFELEAIVKPVKQLTLGANSTLLHTEDSFGNRLIRRPPQTYTARMLAQPLIGFVPKAWEGLDIYADVLHESERTDLGPGATFKSGNVFDVTKVRNPHYTRADFAVSYRFLCHWRAFAKIENFNNAKYQDILTFPSDRSTTLAGIEFNWKF